MKSGADNFKRQIDRIAAKVRRLADTKQVSFKELFTPEFMARHTTYQSMEACFEAAGIKTEEDFRSTPDEALQAHVRANSTFNSFNSMAQAALTAWASQQLGERPPARTTLRQAGVGQKSTMHDSALDEPLRDLDDALDDFMTASGEDNAHNILSRFPVAFRSEPLAGFLRSVLPPADVSKWLEDAMRTRGGMIGSGTMRWPADRATRVALQIALVDRLAEDESACFGFVHEFCNSGFNSITSDYHKFGEVILRPLRRDIERLAEKRPVPPVLFEALGNLPPSGDATLDQLLDDAVGKFKDAAPLARKEGLERLWDAWERLKSLEVEGNKKMSVAALLDRAAPEPEFRAVLESEARALTDIGNRFHIRHYERDKSPLASERYVDYLFHRLFALMHLLLFARTSEGLTSA